jgi:purine-nucleoside phosphorylase
MDYFSGNSEFYANCISDAQRVLKSVLDTHIKLIIQTGSGFDVASEMPLPLQITIPYTHIPHFPPTSVKGHEGKLHVFGRGSNQVLVLEGRFHAYENRDAWELAFPIRVLAITRPNLFLFTNAAGGIRKDMKPGDLVMITNHVNRMGINPLQGLDEKYFGERFLPMDHAYDTEIYDLFEQAAQSENLGVQLSRGAYFASAGPSFETEIEVDSAETLHCDVLGMSTATEVITAKACGLKVSGLSLVTNYACGRGPSNFTHEEVLGVGKKSKSAILKLLAYAVKHL